MATPTAPTPAGRDARHLDRVRRHQGGRSRLGRSLSRRGRRPARPQRRRQVDADQGAVGRLQARRAARSSSTARRRTIANPRDAKAYGIETIYQTLALADNVDAASNLFLGRELLTRWGTLDDVAMEAQARKVMGRLNPNFRRFKDPVKSLSGGQRQSVAIARAIHFNARILIMDEPTAALGPQETRAGRRADQAAEGRGHRHLPHQPRHPRRVRPRRPRAVMKNGQVVGTATTTDVTKDEVLGMIILGKCPPGATPGPGALRAN